MPEVNTCHCCDGLSVQVPVRINNRPGLDVIAYRVGTHPQFNQSLLARLSLSGQKSLAALTTRDKNDFSIGLLDAWSVVADVLTFYQERIANESYLGTATERFSILEMARMIGYELNPGVAATAFMAFTLDETPGALGPALATKNASNLLEGLPPIILEKGIKIQSVPGPGEKAQVFETIAEIEARPVWNAIKPRLTIPQTAFNEIIVFKGTTLSIKNGEMLLVRMNGSTDMKKVLKVTVDNEAKTTRVDLVASPVVPKFSPPPLVFTAIFANFMSFGSSLLQQSTINSVTSQTWREADLTALVKTNKWSGYEVFRSVNTPSAVAPTPEEGVFVFRKKASVFGYNAPKKVTYDSDGVPNAPESWAEWSLAETAGTLYLDSAYEEIIPGSQLVIQNPTNSSTPRRFYEVDKADVSSRTAYNISSKTTAITLQPSDSWWGSGDLAAIRSITVFAQSEQLELAELPIEDAVEGTSLVLDRYYPGLKVGQPVALTGEREDLNGVLASEIVILQDVAVQDGFTVISFKQLTYKYKRKTVSINANVAEATHGETVEEILGGGNAAIPFQQFKLRQPPLTYVSAATETGNETTLEIRVNDILWKEVKYFLDHGPDERIYITRLDNDGKTTVIFGDGITGARLPTGAENIRAKYRKGIGTGGVVKANQLSQLMTMPLGVKSAVNPTAAAGAEDAEVLEDARTNAPMTILTLERIVSLQDYEDFARTFAGIGKSLATWTWKDRRRHVYITVAGTNGATVEEDLRNTLLTAINNAGNERVAITLETYTPAFFQVVANIQADETYLPDKVLADIEQRLRDEFSFDKRKFGQPVVYSEVVACIQHTKGVIAVDIDYLYRSDQSESLNYLLPSAMPGAVNDSVTAAELLTLDARPVDLKIIS
jgi:predicted phage baseplate assembly protein